MASLSLFSRVITYQPFKAVFVLFALILNAIKLPYWLIIFLPRTFRQHPKFTYRQAVRTEILRNALRTSSAIRVVTPLRLQPDRSVRDTGRFVRIDPSPDKTASAEGGRYTGVVSSSIQIRPVPIYGIWYPKAPSTEDLERFRLSDTSSPLVLHFHGGAFALGGPNPDYLGFLGNLLSESLGTLLASSYRLSSNPKGTFPAALQDAISAYSFVLSHLGVPARRVVISGDSAGANIALSLLRYIARYPEAGLDAPGAALLWSPWVNVKSALDPSSIPSHPNAGADYITENFAYWGASTIQQISSTEDSASNEVAIDGPWLSPGLHPFQTSTPIWIQASGLEVLSDDIQAFAKDMDRIKGNAVQLHLEPIAHHDIVLVGHITGFEVEAKHVVDEARKWLAETLKL